MPVDSRLRMMVGVIVLGLLVVGLVILGGSAFFQMAIVLLLVLVLVGIATLFNLKDEWTNFWVIEYSGLPIACAKLCRFPAHSILFDLFVVAEWRGQGIGSFLVNHLAQKAKKPFYLACLRSTVSFYTRLGFTPIPLKQLPPSIQRNLGVTPQSSTVPLVLR